MDITAFSDDNFDTKSWINNILKNSENQDKKENYTMSLVMKLQLYVQQVNTALEDTSQQVLASLPKIMRDTKNLQAEAMVLKEKMTYVKNEIIEIEQETGNSINTIEKLDRIKNDLIFAKQGLHESDNWTVIVNDLEEVFDSKNIELISTKILGMQQSLKLLVNVVDYEDRRLQLEGLKNRLEAIASPAIVQAFTSNNTEQSVMYARIFKSIDRLPQLLKYYHKCQKDFLLKKWRSQVEIEQDESVSKWIHNYYDNLLSNWHAQHKWFQQVFPHDATFRTLTNVYTDTLSNLDPSLNDCIDAALKQIPEKLSFLHEIMQTNKYFARNLREVMEATTQSKSNKEAHESLLKAVYAPFTIYVSKYAAFEQGQLSQNLANNVKCIREDLPDTIHALGMSIPLIFDFVRESKKRCLEITENCGYCGLLIALRSFLLNYANQHRVAQRQLDRIKSKEEDWNTFQLCLSLLQHLGDVLLNLQQLEKDLTTTALQFNKSETIAEYKDLLLRNGERKEFDSLIKCITEGTELSLLDQVRAEFSKLCSDLHHTTYQVVFAPISTQLDFVKHGKMQNNLDLSNSDLPDYSLSPQEYITQIGQYLLTLPQHLEPFLFRENPTLISALKAADSEYNVATDVEGALADVFLAAVARGTCQSYCDHILAICELSNASSRQLAHDISYLGNVLQDLGHALTNGLEQLCLLLKIPADQYQANSSGCTARYVAAVRQMRNISSVG